jgi:hypothetical protein
MSQVNPAPYEQVRAGEQLLFTLNNLQDSLDDTAVNALTGWQNFYDTLIALAITKDHDRTEQIRRHAVNILKVVQPVAIGVSGVAQVETATAAGTISGSGNLVIIVTAAGMTGSPKTYSVAVLNGDTPTVWAGKVRAALAADLALTRLYSVGGTTTAITLTSLTPAANDTTLKIDMDNDTSTGATTAHTSANTTAGVAQGSAAADAVVVAWTNRADAIAFANALMAASPVPAGFVASAFTQ